MKTSNSMNNKDFIQTLASDLAITPKAAQKMTSALIATLAENLDSDTSLSIQGFGSFEAK